MIECGGYQRSCPVVLGAATTDDLGIARMNGVIGDILPLAIGVAISPIPIIAAILMLFSAHAATTSSGFLVGWIAGIVVAVALFTALAGSIGGDGPQAAWVGWTKILLGVLLVVVGIRQWRGRHEQHGPPKWMSAIDRMGFGQALGLGFALSAINPKNLLIAVAAGLAIGSAGLPSGSAIVAIAIFTVIAGCTVAVPVVAHAVAENRMRKPLDEAKAWLQTNNATVMAVLILVIGTMLIGKGLGSL